MLKDPGLAPSLELASLPVRLNGHIKCFHYTVC